jgi:uncharacterized protein YggE
MAKLGLLAVLIVTGAVLRAQTPAPQTVQAIGNATISVNPDQVQIDAGAVTQGVTAQEAAEKNATLAAALINALKSVLGATGTIQTVGYAVTPRYNNPPNGQTPAIVGYIASNTVQVTSADITLAGKLIDAANAAGANSVSGLTFGLHDPEPVKQQALTAASKQAMAHAAAIASGLGGKTGVVIAALEGASSTPIVAGFATTAATPTPIQTGTVSVYATVTVTVQLVQ